MEKYQIVTRNVLRILAIVAFIGGVTCLIGILSGENSEAFPPPKVLIKIFMLGSCSFFFLNGRHTSIYINPSKEEISKDPNKEFNVIIDISSKSQIKTSLAFVAIISVLLLFLACFWAPFYLGTGLSLIYSIVLWVVTSLIFWKIGHSLKKRSLA
jgi:hypothetical protein